MLGLPCEVLENIFVPIDTGEHDRIVALAEAFDNVGREIELVCRETRVVGHFDVGVNAGVIVAVYTCEVTQ